MIRRGENILGRNSDDIEVRIGRPRSGVGVSDGALRRLAKSFVTKNRGHGSGGFNQRVTVKARTVKHGEGGKGAKRLRVYINYLAKEAASQEGDRAVLFSDVGVMPPEDARALMSSWAKDEHSFRFIISPEFGRDIDIKSFADAVIKSAERQLNTKLQFIYGCHYDTDQPHLHLLVRGIRDNGQVLFIPRDFFRFKFREICEQEVTLRIGKRESENVLAALLEKGRKEGITSLDYGLLELSKAAEDGVINLTEHWFSSESELSRAKNKAYQSRLTYLSSIGLATNMGSGKWKLSDDALAVLRTVTREKSLKERFKDLLLGDRGSLFIAHGEDNPLTDGVVGEVLWYGHIDELAEDKAVLIQGIDGTTRFVPLGKFGDLRQQSISSGMIVSIKVPSPRRMVEEVLDRELNERGGSFCLKEFEEKVRDGVVAGKWVLAEGVTVPDYIDLFRTRLDSLTRMGIVVREEEGRYLIPDSLVQKVAGSKSHVSALRNKVYGELVSRIPLEALVSYDGATVLDRFLSSGAELLGGFGARVSACVEHRRGFLGKKGVKIDDLLYVRLRRDELYRVITSVASKLKTRIGVALKDHRVSERSQAIVLKKVLLSDARYLVIKTDNGIWYVKDTISVGDISVGDEVLLEKGRREAHLVKSYTKKKGLSKEER